MHWSLLGKRHKAPTIYLEREKKPHTSENLLDEGPIQDSPKSDKEEKLSQK